jgi:hypothetical protein
MDSETQSLKNEENSENSIELFNDLLLLTTEVLLTTTNLLLPSSITRI